MDETLHNDDLLIRYLDGELSAEEKNALELRLNTDEGLRTKLEQLQVAVQALHQFGTAEKVSGIHTEMMKELKKPQTGKVMAISRRLRYALAIAASILVLFVGIKIYQGNNLSSERLFNEAFVDFNASVSRGAEGSESAIEKHYQQKDYRAVLADVRSANMTAKDSLLLGLSCLQTGRLQQAIGLFEKLAFTQNDFQPDAEFYLALSYLKNKNYQKSLSVMQKIASNRFHLYHENLSADVLNGVEKLSAEK